MNLGGEPPIVIETTRRVVHVEFTFDDRLPAVECLEFRKFRRVFSDEVRHCK